MPEQEPLFLCPGGSPVHGDDGQETEVLQDLTNHLWSSSRLGWTEQHQVGFVTSAAFLEN